MWAMVLSNCMILFCFQVFIKWNVGEFAVIHDSYVFVLLNNGDFDVVNFQYWVQVEKWTYFDFSFENFSPFSGLLVELIWSGLSIWYIFLTLLQIRKSSTYKVQFITLFYNIIYFDIKQKVISSIGVVIYFPVTIVKQVRVTYC